MPTYHDSPVGTDARSARELAIPAEIGHLRHAADELEGTVKALIERLAGVLASPPNVQASPNDQARPPRPGPKCQLEDDLRQIRDRISISCGALQQMMQHLEV